MQTNTFRQARALFGITIFCFVTGMFMHILRSSNVAIASILPEKIEQNVAVNTEDTNQAIKRIEHLYNAMYEESEQACMYRE